MSRLGFLTRSGYAAAECGHNAVETVLRLFVLMLYVDVAGADPSWTGLVVALSVFWDAVTDPLMGLLSDRSSGRGRAFWLLPGAAILAVGAAALVSPPLAAGQGAVLAWLGMALLLVQTGSTVLAIPHQALPGDLTEDPHERSALYAWRFFAANLGLLAAIALSGDPGEGEESLSALPRAAVPLALLVLITAAVSWVATRRTRPALPTRAGRPRATFSRALRSALGNRALRPVLLAYLVATAGLALNQSLARFYYEKCLLLAKAQTDAVLMVFLLVFSLSLVFWLKVSHRVGKAPALVRGTLLLGLGGSLIYPLLPEGAFGLTIALSAVLLGALVGTVPLLDSLLTDVADHERARRGQADAGLLFGLWRFGSKLARALAIGLSGLLLSAIGYERGVEVQGPETRAALRLAFGPGVGAFLLAGALIMARWRFTPAKQEQVRRILRRRGERRSG